MPMTRGIDPRLLKKGLDAIYFNTLKKRPNEYEKWINVHRSQQAYEEHYRVSGLGPFQEFGEGQPYKFDAFQPGQLVRYVHRKFGLAFRLTEEMRDDEQYGVVSKLTKELAISAYYNKEIHAHRLLNHADDDTFTGFDGEPLLSTQHPIRRTGGVQSNTLETHADLSKESLQGALEAFETMQNDRGMPALLQAKYLAFSPRNLWTAHELLESEKDPTSGDNAINVISSRFGLTPLQMHFLQAPDAWFLLAGKGDHDLNMFIRKDDTFKDYIDEGTDDIIYKGRHRFSVGFGEWYGVWGTPGA